MKKIIGIGLGAGALAGMSAFGYARVQVAPLIAQAIHHEDERSHMLAGITAEHSHGHEVFTRAVQENVGAGVGVIGFGMVVGVLFAVAYAMVSSSLSALSRSAGPAWVATALSVVGLIAVSLVPALVYPANPPGVGQEETAGQRTVAYLALLVVSVAAVAVLTAVALRFAPRVGAWTSVMGAVWAYVGVIALAATILPRVHEVPAGFPADLLYEFRLQSVLTAAVMWMVLGTAFAGASARALPARIQMTVKEVVHDGR
ncbi:CbtA family protein [Mycolicibacterium austroafricanum]|uniref:CbtA family protein n=1 Tax=Mycolicibacterium austroafricanum TaxID=39687 RepID=UPI000560BE86|nr:CbtA family protein [Mycolicibacterium austroafricanum]QZY46757.1 CbtA family protein [Mycolicibacterium austroafricanum]